jgi:virginiamycin B lyase
MRTLIRSAMYALGALLIASAVLGTPRSASAFSITEFTQNLTANSAPTGITADNVGNLWFTENATGNIGRITTVGAITEFALPIAGSKPTGITKDVDGNLWFTEPERNRIGRIDVNNLPFGATNPIIVTVTGSPFGIVSDGAIAERIWFTESVPDLIGNVDKNGGGLSEIRFDPAGVASPARAPQGITVAADGALWFTETSANRIGRIDPNTNAITEFSQGISANSAPAGIAAGVDGNLWFTESAAGKIGRITPGGVVTEFNLPDKNSNPTAIAVGPDNNLWFTETNAGKIGVIALGDPADTSGALAPAIAEFPIPTAASAPKGIVADPSGQGVWFTENQAIGHFLPDTANGQTFEVLVSAAPNPSRPGQPVTLTALILGSSVSGGINGDVNFFDNSTTPRTFLGASKVVNGVGRLVVTLGKGAHNISAEFTAVVPNQGTGAGSVSLAIDEASLSGGGGGGCAAGAGSMFDPTLALLTLLALGRRIIRRCD